MTQAQTALALAEAAGVAAAGALTSEPVIGALTGNTPSPSVVAFVFVGAFIAKLLPHDMTESVIGLIGQSLASAKAVDAVPASATVTATVTAPTPAQPAAVVAPVSAKAAKATPAA